MKKRKRHTGWIVVLCMAAAIAVIAGIYSRFGGFGTGNCADTEEFAKYAASVSELTVPDEVQIVALGEATHGNKEFQQLRLDVLQVLVEKYGVRAFALEGDFGGCEAINRYIHGEGGTAAEALSATGFAIYRTEEMENLVEWIFSAIPSNILVAIWRSACCRMAQSLFLTALHHSVGFRQSACLTAFTPWKRHATLPALGCLSQSC